jgi:hypothetical protein
VIIRFVDIGGIGDHHCLEIAFHNIEHKASGSTTSLLHRRNYKNSNNIHIRHASSVNRNHTP